MNEDTNFLSKDNLSADVQQYEQSLQQLQDLVKQIESKETSFSELLQKVTTANELAETCKQNLRQVSQKMNLEK